MPEKSLTYFLFFLILYCIYVLYHQDKELDRMLNLVEKQHSVVNQQKKAIEAQSLYIKLLESQLQYDYYKNSNPIHKNPPI